MDGLASYLIAGVPFVAIVLMIWTGFSFKARTWYKYNVRFELRSGTSEDTKIADGELWIFRQREITHHYIKIHIKRLLSGRKDSTRYEEAFERLSGGRFLIKGDTQSKVRRRTRPPKDKRLIYTY